MIRVGFKPTYTTTEGGRALTDAGADRVTRILEIAARKSSPKAARIERAVARSLQNTEYVTRLQSVFGGLNILKDGLAQTVSTASSRTVRGITSFFRRWKPDSHTSLADIRNAVRETSLRPYRA